MAGNNNKPPATAPPDGKMSRIGAQARGLADDIKAWVELKIQLVELDVQERIEGFANQVVVGVILGVVAFLALTFLLTAGALALGGWIGSDAAGFGLVGLVLAVVAGVVYLVKPRIVQRPAAKPPKELTNGKMPQLPAAATADDHGKS